jgi:hypothetical protein
MQRPKSHKRRSKRKQPRKMMTSSEALKKMKNLLKKRMRIKMQRKNKLIQLNLLIQIRSKLLLQWLMNSTILSPKISLCMLSMMTSHLLTVDHQMLLSWSLKCSSKSISQETFSWKIHSRLVFYQESFILSRELSSFTHTRLWTTWHKQSWSRINSTFLIYLDTLSHQKVIFLSSVDSTHKAENFCTKPTSLTSTDLF